MPATVVDGFPELKEHAVRVQDTLAAAGAA